MKCLTISISFSSLVIDFRSNALYWRSLSSKRSVPKLLWKLAWTVLSLDVSSFKSCETRMKWMRTYVYARVGFFSRYSSMKLKKWLTLFQRHYVYFTVWWGDIFHTLCFWLASRHCSSIVDHIVVDESTNCHWIANIHSIELPKDTRFKNNLTLPQAYFFALWKKTQGKKTQEIQKLKLIFPKTQQNFQKLDFSETSRF